MNRKRKFIEANASLKTAEMLNSMKDFIGIASKMTGGGQVFETHVGSRVRLASRLQPRHFQVSEFQLGITE